MNTRALVRFGIVGVLGCCALAAQLIMAQRARAQEPAQLQPFDSQRILQIARGELANRPVPRTGEKEQPAVQLVSQLTVPDDHVLLKLQHFKIRRAQLRNLAAAASDSAAMAGRIDLLVDKKSRAGVLDARDVRFCLNALESAGGARRISGSALIAASGQTVSFADGLDLPRQKNAVDASDAAAWRAFLHELRPLAVAADAVHFEVHMESGQARAENSGRRWAGRCCPVN